MSIYKVIYNFISHILKYFSPNVSPFSIVSIKYFKLIFVSGSLSKAINLILADIYFYLGHNTRNALIDLIEATFEELSKRLAGRQVTNQSG